MGKSTEHIRNMPRDGMQHCINADGDCGRPGMNVHEKTGPSSDSGGKMNLAPSQDIAAENKGASGKY